MNRPRNSSRSGVGKGHMAVSFKCQAPACVLLCLLAVSLGSCKLVEGRALTMETTPTSSSFALGSDAVQPHIPVDSGTAVAATAAAAAAAAGTTVVLDDHLDAPSFGDASGSALLGSALAGPATEAPSEQQALLWHQQLQERAAAAAAALTIPDEAGPVAAAAAAAAAAGKVLMGREAALGMTPKQERLILERHNLYRAAHQVQPLQWSKQLAAEASDWAAQCRFEHDHMAAAGDNLFVNSVADYSQLDRQVLLGVDLWYDEQQFYDYNLPGFSSSTGHFTQLVWRESTQLGCAMQLCFDGITADPPIASTQGTILVCRYSLAGNSGKYAQNVLPRTYKPQPRNLVDATQPPAADDRPNQQPNYDLTATQRLLASGRSTTGCRYSADNRFKLCLLEDSRLVLYKLTTAVWVSHSGSRDAGRPYQLFLHPTGILTVKSAKTGEVAWRSSGQAAGSQGRYQLMLSNKGVLSVQDKDGKAVWSPNK